ncbi:hypothetical protein [Clostridium massiliamazoniense]|uniref:hypothetical protein n=1 Tax=Clostridium massiliamazoniense TaxID=1347366 RepID=UPI0006D85445|nr:hypothetical protein [Clostridium massiliamazoniense]
MNKKLISALLTMSIFLGTSSIAMAETIDNSTTTEAELTVTGEVAPAIINVEIPTTLGFKIDPFNIGKAGKVNTSVMTIENKSNVPVEIQMSKLKGSASGDLNLVESPAEVTNEGDSKDAFLWIGQLAVTPDKNEEGKFTSVKPLGAYNEAKNKQQVVTGTEGSEVVSMGSLVEATYDEEGDYSATNAKGKMYLGILGDVRTVDGWAEEDGVEITATFTVQPKAVGSIK